MCDNGDAPRIRQGERRAAAWRRLDAAEAAKM